MKKIKDNCMFKVGQEVWCLVHGKGSVVDIIENDEDYGYPVIVNFENERYGYTKEGKYAILGNRTLYFSEPKIEAQEFPSKYAGKTVFAVSKNDSGAIFGPSVVKAEYEDHISVDGYELFKSDYNFYIVEQDKE
jgi:hypothetical protein